MIWVIHSSGIGIIGKSLIDIRKELKTNILFVAVKRDEQITIGDLGVDDEVKFKMSGSNEVIYAKGLVGRDKDLNVDINSIKSLMNKD